MGIVSSYIWPNTGRTDDPDPITGLTSRDKYLIASSWNVVRKNPTENGVALFCLLFKNHPEYQQLFPFRDIPLKDLPQNKRFQAHCNVVIYSFSSIVDSISEDELLVQLLSKIGETHVPRNTTIKSFLDLKSTLTELFSTLFNEEEMKAWAKTLDVAFNQITKAMNEVKRV